MPEGAPRESLNLRVSPWLKRRIEVHPAETGISINAAAAGPRAERRRW